MVFRLFIVIIGLLCAFMAYDSVRLVLVKSSAQKADDGYATEADNADLTVVEFLNYGCSDCQDIHPAVMQALDRDGRIRYLPRPVLIEQSAGTISAAKLAYAAGRQGKFMDAHEMLIENFRAIDEAYIDHFSSQLEIDPEQLRTDLKDPEIAKTIEDNTRTLARLKARSVPSFLIGNKILLQVNGALPTSDELLSLFSQARAF